MVSVKTSCIIKYFNYIKHFEFAHRTGNEYVWYGGKRKDDVFVWSDSTSFIKSFWNTGEPNNVRGEENCLHLLISGKWNDINCADSFYYVCKLHSRKCKESVESFLT